MLFPIHAFGAKPCWKARTMGHYSAFPLLPLQQDSGVWAGCIQSCREDECDCLVSRNEIIHQCHEIYIQCELCFPSFTCGQPLSSSGYGTWKLARTSIWITRISVALIAVESVCWFSREVRSPKEAEEHWTIAELFSRSRSNFPLCFPVGWESRQDFQPVKSPFFLPLSSDLLLCVRGGASPLSHWPTLWFQKCLLGLAEWQLS